MDFELKLESLKYLRRTQIVIEIAAKVLNLGLFFQKKKLIYKLFVSSSPFSFSFSFSFSILFPLSGVEVDTCEELYTIMSGLPIYLLI